jgi:mono/diheme cytochrome c family protein
MSFSAQQGLAAPGESVPLSVRPDARDPEVRVFPAAERRWLHAEVAREGGRPVLSLQPVARRLAPGVYRAVVMLGDAVPDRVDVRLFVSGRGATACPPGSTLRYEGGGDAARGEPADFGRGFFARHCVGCHGSAVREPRRSGAPAGMNWDGLEAIRRERAWIDAVASRDEAPADEAPIPGMVMPPRGARTRPSAEERRQLAEWIACGAP